MDSLEFYGPAPGQTDEASEFPDTQDPTSADEIYRSQLNRRGFCEMVLIGSTGLLLLENGASANAAERETQQTAFPPLKIEGAEALMPGSSLYFHYPRKIDPAILVRSQQGEYYAFSQKCTHRGCSVYYDRARGCLECLCHMGAYDARTGFVLYGPPNRPVDPIYLQIRAGGEIWAVGKGIGGDERLAVARY
jgi:Rieske Fe-S protein